MKGVKVSTGKTEDTYVIRIAIDKSVDKTYRDELLSAVKRLTAGVPVARSSRRKKSTDDDDIEYVDVPSLPVRSLPVDVGMWKEVEGDGLPDPVPHDKPFKDQARFLIWLAHVERNLAKCKVYKGSSTCRICGDWNGTKEYEYNGFRWPEGYSHYIEEHNVRPDKAFYDMIMSVK